MELPVDQKSIQKKLSRRGFLKAAALSAAGLALAKTRKFIDQALTAQDERNISATVVAGLDSGGLEKIAGELPKKLRQTAVYIEFYRVGFASGVVIENSPQRVIILTAKHVIEYYEGQKSNGFAIHQPQNQKQHMIEYGAPDTSDVIRIVKDQWKDIGIFVIEQSALIPDVPDKGISIVKNYVPNVNEDLYTFAFPQAATIQGGYYPDVFRLSAVTLVTTPLGLGYSVDAKLTEGGSGSGVANNEGLIGILVSRLPGIASQFFPIGESYDQMVAQLDAK